MAGSECRTPRLGAGGVERWLSNVAAVLSVAEHDQYRHNETLSSLCRSADTSMGPAEQFLALLEGTSHWGPTQLIQTAEQAAEGSHQLRPPLAVNPTRLQHSHTVAAAQHIAMLSLVARQSGLARQLLPAAALAASAHVQERGMKIFEVGGDCRVWRCGS